MNTVMLNTVKDFPTFLKSGQGPVENGEKKHLDHKNWEKFDAVYNRTGPPFQMD